MKRSFILTAIFLFVVGSVYSEQIKNEKVVDKPQKKNVIKLSRKIIIGDWSISANGFKEARMGTVGLRFLTNHQYKSIIFYHSDVRLSRSTQGKWKLSDSKLILTEKGHKNYAKVVISNNHNIMLEFNQYKMYLYKKNIEKDKK